MKSNDNKITTHLNGSFAVPFTMTIKTIVISNQDCSDGKWNALITTRFHEIINVSVLFERFMRVFITIWLLIIMIKQCCTENKWTGLCPKGQSCKAEMFFSPINIQQKPEGISVTCNAFCRSPVNKFDAILALTIISHKFGCSSGPVCIHSLMLFEVGEGCALQSNTILVLVVEAFSLHTGL